LRRNDSSTRKAKCTVREHANEKVKPTLQNKYLRRVVHVIFQLA